VDQVPRGYTPCRVVENRELCGPTADRSTKFICLDLSDMSTQGPVYETGDHLEIAPRNPTCVIDTVLCRLGLSPTATFTLVPLHAHQGAEPSTPCTVGEALSRVDLSAPPPRAFLHAIGRGSSSDARSLRKCARDLETYQQLILKPRLSVGEVLTVWPDATVSLADVVTILPPLRPRSYSIASSSLSQPNHAALTVGVVQYTKDAAPHAGPREIVGVASFPLGHTVVGEMVWARARSSTFRLPHDPSVPIIAVAAGTGVAPFRGFLEHRRAMAEGGEVLGPFHLFFGCRRRGEDDYFAQEWEAYRTTGEVTEVHLALSRETQTRVYVQDLLIAQGPTVWDILQAGGHVYVCGDARTMAQGVHQALVDICSHHVGGDAEAVDYLERLTDEGRYSRDVWG